MRKLLATIAVSLALATPSFAIDTPRELPNANFVLSNDDYLVSTKTAFTAPRTVTLPQVSRTCISVNNFPPCPAQSLFIIDAAGTITSTNTLTIIPAAGDTINGSATPIVLSAARSKIELFPLAPNAWYGSPDNGVGPWLPYSFPSASAGGNFSTSEYMISNNVPGQNIATFYNSNAAGFAAITMRGSDNVEHMALGFANPGAGYCGGSCSYLEVSNYPDQGSGSPPPFYFNRTGYINGSFGVFNSMRVENAASGIEGRWNWFVNPGVATSIAVMNIDPTNDFVTINNQLLIGNLNTPRTPVATIDSYGNGIFGSNATNRATDSTFLLNTNQSTANQLRLQNAFNFKYDVLLNVTPNRVDFRDTDHSNKIALSLAADGTGNVTAGGSISATIANIATTSAVCYNTGTGLFTYNATVGTCTVSDIRTKNVDGPIIGALDRLMMLHGFYFHYKDPALGPKPQLGLSAQDVEVVFPQLVSEDSNGLKSLDYQKLVAPMIEAMRELKAENDNLRACQDSWKCRLFGR